MKKLTKKFIQSVLRTNDRTKIYQLASMYYKKKPTQGLVYALMDNYAPTKKVRSCMYNIAFLKPERYDKTSAIRNMISYQESNPRQIAMEFFRKQLTMLDSNYVKQPMLGYTHLYFCSPIYGHSDYNKVRSLPIKGNERFCELLVSYGKKFFQH